MGLAAADGAYLQYSSSSVYRKPECTAGAYVQKCATRDSTLSKGVHFDPSIVYALFS